MPDDHVGHLVRYREHQVDVGCPVRVLHHLEGHVGVGFVFQFIEKPKSVEVGVLVFQGILEGSELCLCFSEGRAQAEQHTACQQQGNEFLHGVILLCLYFRA